ncbi:hypothetical protein CAEBREN_09884 [Caenorhabditis brenneri]|uniref:Sdz-33 F-box domain-containing protein n=1 Tax=Caenorhabditis brenneri TaxID=135651 RepID=G0MX24_CAEBE|nr:hypothetical protein CAEBREN_09884 [Caenorhabditis brenneri]
MRAHIKYALKGQMEMEVNLCCKKLWIDMYWRKQKRNKNTIPYSRFSNLDYVYKKHEPSDTKFSYFVFGDEWVTYKPVSFESQLYWNDPHDGFYILFEYLIELLDLKVEFIIQPTLFIEPLFYLIELMNSYDSKIESVTYSGHASALENITYANLLRQTKMKTPVYFELTNTVLTQTVGVFSVSTAFLYIMDAGWLTIENLKSFKCIGLQLGGVTYSDHEINAFLKYIKKIECPNSRLKYISMELDESRTIDLKTLLGGIKCNLTTETRIYKMFDDFMTNDVGYNFKMKNNDICAVQLDEDNLLEIFIWKSLKRPRVLPDRACKKKRLNL